jgi:proteasome accessory factor C
VSDVHERLRRLLLLVPFVRKNPGIRVDELARALGSTREALLQELDLLTMVGRPPFQPDDFIDLHVEDDRVWVDLDIRLSKPPRLTAAEAASLFAAASLLKPAAKDALQSALQKLEAVLPREDRERFHQMGDAVDAHLQAPEELAPLTRAIAERREVTFDYFSQGRGQTEARSVKPYELFAHRGAWYLNGYCNTRGDERLFRVDRLRHLSLTEARFERPQRTQSHIPNPASGRGEVVVRFSKTAAPYVRERFGEQASTLPDGGVEVRVSGESERWLVQWVLSFGGEAVVQAPGWARAAVARAASGSVKS